MQIVTDAIVLTRSEYRDYDRMATLFSPTYGRLDCVAYGSRRPKSELHGCVEPFCAGEFTLAERNGRLSVHSADVKQRFSSLTRDYDRFANAAYCLALADAVVMPDQPASALFFLLLTALTHMGETELPPAMLSSAFEMRMMPLLGFAPRMAQCALCGRSVDGACRFDASLGGAVCLSCPSRAPAMSAGARRIVLRAAETNYRLVPKLDGHPDWPEAARLYRPFVLERIDLHGRALPDLP